MKITSELVARKLAAYLHHELSLAEMVDWAEGAMMEGELSDEGYESIRDVVARLGVADVREFGLSWDDCEEMLHKLGYVAHIEVVAQ